METFLSFSTIQFIAHCGHRIVISRFFVTLLPLLKCLVEPKKPQFWQPRNDAGAWNCTHQNQCQKSRVNWAKGHHDHVHHDLCHSVILPCQDNASCFGIKKSLINPSHVDGFLGNHNIKALLHPQQVPSELGLGFFAVLMNGPRPGKQRLLFKAVTISS